MVRFRKILYRGRFQKPARARSALVLTGVVVLVLTIFTHYAFVLDQAVYYLPEDEIPVFQMPKTIAHRKDPKSVDDLVSTCYEFSIVVEDQTVFISCPVIYDDCAQDFNSMVVTYLNTVVSNTKAAVECGNPIVVKSFNYQAFYDLEQNILTVILFWETQDEDSNEIWMFDLSEDRLLETAELPARFLGTSYAQFILATDTYIVQRFSEEYFVKSTSDEDSEYYYRAIINHIPSDLTNMVTRYVFPSDGKLYFAYELPILCDQYGRLEFRTTTHIDAISAEFLESLESTSISNAIADVIYGSTVHIMGGSDQSHSSLLRQLFLENPAAYISASTNDPSYAIQRLLAYATEEERTTIHKLCTDLILAKVLTEEEISIVGQVISEMN